MRPTAITDRVIVALIVCATVGANTGLAEPIKSIFIDVGGTDPAPLNYEYDGGAGEGELTIQADSFTLLVTRDDNGVDVPEFHTNASFSLTASSLVDVSKPPSAAGGVATGVFSQVSFELRDSLDNLLLSATQNVDTELLYAEALVPDVMFINGGPLNVTGGSFVPDFDIQARLFGIGFQIDPGTTTFGALDTNHSGAIKLNVYPIPEPTTLFLWALLAGGCGGRRLFGRGRR